jgi:hypothetical protein
MQIRNKFILVITFIIKSIYFSSEQNCAAGSAWAPPRGLTESTLANLYDRLQDFKTRCGEYPKNDERLQSFYFRPKELNCLQTPNAVTQGAQIRDGWGKPISYTSDGKHFLVEMSHGYSLTEDSPGHPPYINPNQFRHWNFLNSISGQLEKSELPNAGRTEELLEDFHKQLGYFKKLCGRYPTTEEGISALKSDPKIPDCPKYLGFKSVYEQLVYQKGVETKDGWGQQFKYTSSGSTFRLDASHGFFLTETSPAHIRESASTAQWHWTNSNPPSEEIPIIEKMDAP